MNKTTTFFAENKDNNLRLDKFLTAKLKNFTRSQIKKIITSANVKINNRIVTSASEKIKKGSKINVEIKKNKTQLTIQAYSGNAEGSDGLNTAVYNKVIAASAPKNSEDVILETKDYGEISAAEAIKFKSNK